MVNLFYFKSLIYVNIRIMMKNRHLGILIVLAGVIVIFLDIDSWGWIISALLIGGGSGIAIFWRDKLENEEDK